MQRTQDAALVTLSAPLRFLTRSFRGHSYSVTLVDGEAVIYESRKVPCDGNCCPQGWRWDSPSAIGVARWNGYALVDVTGLDEEVTAGAEDAIGEQVDAAAYAALEGERRAA